ncbi:Helicase domain containing protein [uncultured Caudovirales phage]|uniref:Helicase domain containing protein n=1 Tax=uncultured Caudovirales phage TaxID=2100421 RepID=A0A6J5KSW5_9CAUD|nr:Helicase domain containing protein [uncultured Caudovirales phage]
MTDTDAPKRGRGRPPGSKDARPRQRERGNPKQDLGKKPPGPGTTPTGADHGPVGVSIPEKVSPKANTSSLSPNPPPPGAPTAAPPPNPKTIKSLTEGYAYFVEVYRNQPVRFVEDVLKAKPLAWQVEFMEKVARGERRISVRAGHGVGKSTACSWVLIWFMLTRFPQKSVLTAPTAGQLFDALFSEVKRWINVLPDFLKDSIEVFSDRIVLKSAPESSFMSARTSSAERPEALAGVHSENVLLIVDEASAIPEPVFESAAGSMSGHSATTVLIGNPTRNTGLFFRTHNQLSQDWNNMHVSCLDNPLVATDFVNQIKATYGETSNAFRVRVLGEFSLREDDVLIAAELVDGAMNRDVVLDPKEPVLYGVDVARFGDDRTVIVKRQGAVVTEVRSWTGADLMETTGRIVHEAEIDKPAEILVDSIGLGSGVADRLRELGYNVRDVNVSESAAMNPQAARLRDELWLTVRDWLNQRTCKIPKSDQLRAELCAPTYGFTSSGKIKVEGKSELKRRGMRSPDIADALCLTFAGAAAMVGGRASRWVSGKSLKRGIVGIV